VSIAGVTLLVPTPAMGPRPMAARHAACTVGGALVVDLEHPTGGSEWDRVTNVEWETGRVDFVTRAAGSALGPVDVQPGCDRRCSLRARARCAASPGCSVSNALPIEVFAQLLCTS
jgi:hypothetical protein